MIDAPGHDEPGPDRTTAAALPDAGALDPDEPATPSRFRRLTVRIEDFQRRLAEHRTRLEPDEQKR
ncbi:hypothetical protein AB0A74_21060 [Saccharothrix sp. NPDC042600]|uniref:hypothetical protein n=1 Tax=Saccharothrix TaxID=2071 RepID=UPI0033E13E63|nr:hypothetical protein GCM10017745_55310 [Saccharothrix mutabilis subsp. capreolus]